MARASCAGSVTAAKSSAGRRMPIGLLTCTQVRGGNPILFPFVARHFVDGKNELWRDAKGTVRSMPQHGFCRDARFSVVEDEPENTLRMRFVDSDEDSRVFYPFSFQFDVVVSLLPASRLEVRFETTNTGSAPLPYYAGHHFYFAMPHQERADWTLSSGANSGAGTNPIVSHSPQARHAKSHAPRRSRAERPHADQAQRRSLAA